MRKTVITVGDRHYAADLVVGLAVKERSSPLEYGSIALQNAELVRAVVSQYDPSVTGVEPVATKHGDRYVLLAGQDVVTEHTPSEPLNVRVVDAPALEAASIDLEAIVGGEHPKQT